MEYGHEDIETIADVICL